MKLKHFFKVIAFSVCLFIIEGLSLGIPSIAVFSNVTNTKIADHTEIIEKALTKDYILNNKTKYITVGSINCDYATIKEALKVVDSKRNTICLMNKYQTEAGIKINKDVTIIGLGKQQTILRGAVSINFAKDRVFLIEKGANVKIKWMKICNGYIFKVPRCGAGIYNKGNLQLVNCEISGNKATYGIAVNNEGNLYMEDCIITKNIGLKRPTEDDIMGVDCGGSGAGLKVEKNGKAYLSRCLISNNESVANGGGMHISCEGYASLINCTIIGNKAKADGGGISIRGDVDLIHCTITKNDAKRGNGIMAMGKINMVATIIAGNYNEDFVVGSGYGIYGGGIIGKNEYNLVEKSNLKTYLSGDAKLSFLKSNGGVTKTCALLKSSSAINAIPKNIIYSKTDQRNMKRNDGYEDIGAYEYNLENK